MKHKASYRHIKKEHLKRFGMFLRPGYFYHGAWQHRHELKVIAAEAMRMSLLGPNPEF